MPRKAFKKRPKAIATDDELSKEDRMQLAIERLDLAEQNNEVLSITKAAKQFGIPKSTLVNRYRGKYVAIL